MLTFCMTVVFYASCGSVGIPQSGRYEMCFPTERLRKFGAFVTSEECNARIIEYTIKGTPMRVEILQ